MQEFQLLQVVKIKCSDEHGTIIGLATYAHSETQALVQYKAADGRAVEAWWGVSALIAF